MEKQAGIHFGKDGSICRSGGVSRSASAMVCALGECVDRQIRPVRQVWNLRHELRKMPGQGTTEYAIIVGVLVVIAILAITVFRPKIQELWNAISDGINGL